jgi:hypothetical protein
MNESAIALSKICIVNELPRHRMLQMYETSSGAVAEQRFNLVDSVIKYTTGDSEKIGPKCLSVLVVRNMSSSTALARIPSDSFMNALPLIDSDGPNCTVRPVTSGHLSSSVISEDSELSRHYRQTCTIIDLVEEKLNERGRKKLSTPNPPELIRLNAM